MSSRRRGRLWMTKIALKAFHHRVSLIDVYLPRNNEKNANVWSMWKKENFISFELLQMKENLQLCRKQAWALSCKYRRLDYIFNFESKSSPLAVIIIVIWINNEASKHSHTFCACSKGFFLFFLALNIHIRDNFLFSSKVLSLTALFAQCWRYSLLCSRFLFILFFLFFPITATVCRFVAFKLLMPEKKE